MEVPHSQRSEQAVHSAKPLSPARRYEKYYGNSFLYPEFGSMLSNITKNRVREASSNRLLIFLGKPASKPGKQQKSL